MAFEITLGKGNLGQKSISFLRPCIWNSLNYDLKILNTATSFTQKLVLKSLIKLVGKL